MIKLAPPLIILGAGSPHHGNKHSALRHTSSSNRVLDWVLQVSEFLQPNYHFISGCQAGEVSQRYPEFNYCKNPEWEDTNAAWSLLLGVNQIESQDCLVAFSDILFCEPTVRALWDNTQVDIVVAVDTLWRKRYVGRSSEDIDNSEKVCFITDSGQITLFGTDIDTTLVNAEFVELVKFLAWVVSYLKILFAASEQAAFLRDAKLSELIARLRSLGYSVVGVDVAGDWA